jgi:hypothetical protein
VGTARFSKKFHRINQQYRKCLIAQKINWGILIALDFVRSTYRPTKSSIESF